MEEARKKIVVFTGSGISAESGIRTFRDNGGLWEDHRVEDVATPEAWAKDPELVLRFYNQRRSQLPTVQPNAAHIAIAKLEEQYDVIVVTQNVDDLHERGGSTNIIHIHGSLIEACSSKDKSTPETINYREIAWGEKAKDGSQLRPNIVWFGENVPLYEEALEEVLSCDVFMAVGSSLLVYPAAGLINYAPSHSDKYLIDPDPNDFGTIRNLNVIKAKAGEGVPKLVDELLNQK